MSSNQPVQTLTATPISFDDTPTQAQVPAVVPPTSTQAVVKVSDLMSEEAINKLGGDASQSLDVVSNRILAVQRMSDTGVLGQQLNQLIAEAKGLDPQSLAGKGVVGKVMGLFGNAKEKLLGSYDTVQHRIDTLIGQIDKEMTIQEDRKKDLDDLAQSLRAYHEGLEQAVTQGKAGVVAFDAAIAQLEAQVAGDAFKAADLNDLKDRRNTLDKHVDDFQRNIVFITQTLPSIFLMKQNARDLITTFNEIKGTTIPIWRGVFSTYLISLDQKRAAAVGTSVRDATNEAIRRQADQLGQNAQTIAEARQRSSIDLDTLQYNQNKLMQTLDNVAAIEKKGQADRAAAKPQLEALEKAVINRFANNRAA
jgi:uncharacterized protein YaaN involved in tellurite resistance